MRCALWMVGVVMLGVVGVAPVLRGQKLFEGTITYEVTPGTGTPVELVLRSNGRKLREEMRAPGSSDQANSYQMLDGESGDLVVVIPAAKQYILHNFKQFRAARGERTDSSGSRAQLLLADLTAMGRKETVAGLTCEVYVRKSQPGDEWCLTTALGRFGVFDDEITAGNAMSAAMRPFRNGALVLRMSTGAASGRPMTMVATTIDRTPPPASLFKLPAGYTELKNPMMPKP